MTIDISMVIIMFSVTPVTDDEVWHEPQQHLRIRFSFARVVVGNDECAIMLI